MSIVVVFLVVSSLRRARERFDETKIHSSDQACACCIDGPLSPGIVLRLANHCEDFQQLTLDQLLGQLTVVWVEQVVDNHKATMLNIRVGMETQPLQDLQPLGGLLGEISQLTFLKLKPCQKKISLDDVILTSSAFSQLLFHKPNKLNILGCFVRHNKSASKAHKCVKKVNFVIKYYYNNDMNAFVILVLPNELSFYCKLVNVNVKCIQWHKEWHDAHTDTFCLHNASLAIQLKKAALCDVPNRTTRKIKHQCHRISLWHSIHIQLGPWLI